MGFRMDNLHAPTVGSGSTSNENGDDARSFQELITRKENLEAELSALGSVLDSVRGLTSDEAIDQC
jgi:26S proteasome non-ATPase regulatory subunit 9